MNSADNSSRGFLQRTHSIYDDGLINRTLYAFTECSNNIYMFSDVITGAYPNLWRFKVSLSWLATPSPWLAGSVACIRTLEPHLVATFAHKSTAGSAKLAYFSEKKADRFISILSTRYW